MGEHKFGGLNKVPAVIPPGTQRICLLPGDTISHWELQGFSDLKRFFLAINSRRNYGYTFC